MQGFQLLWPNLFLLDASPVDFSPRPSGCLAEAFGGAGHLHTLPNASRRGIIFTRIYLLMEKTSVSTPSPFSNMFCLGNQDLPTIASESKSKYMHCHTPAKHEGPLFLKDSQFFNVYTGSIHPFSLALVLIWIGR